MKRPRERRAESVERSGGSRQTRTVGRARAGRAGSARRIDSETGRFVPGRPALDGGNTRSGSRHTGGATPETGSKPATSSASCWGGAGQPAKRCCHAMVRAGPSGRGRAGSGCGWRRTAWGAGTGRVVRDPSGGARCVQRELRAEGAGREPLEWMNLPPASGRTSPRGRCERARSRETGAQPHGREWLKEATGFAEA
jgi:hypothetical protein